MLCEHAKMVILVLSLLAATLIGDAVGQSCQGAAADMTSNEHLIFAAGDYVEAMQTMCTESIIASLREGNGVAPAPFMCEFQYDVFTEVTTLKFDGSLAEGAANLKDVFEYACTVDAGGNFCVISFSGGAAEDEEMELVLDYEGLGICIPAECDNSQQDVETLTKHFLKEGGFFGFETGIDISDMGRMPEITCNNGDVIGSGTTQPSVNATQPSVNTTQPSANAFQSASSPASVTSAASSLWSPVYTALVLATVAFFATPSFF
jgi:hypothetical protein